jgi:hypothetical protein
MFSWSVLTCQAVAHAIAEIDPDVPTLTTGFRRRAGAAHDSTHDRAYASNQFRSAERLDDVVICARVKGGQERSFLGDAP